MIFDIITIFPEIFDSYFNESILKRAQKKQLIKIKVHNLRDYTTGRHKIVDDRPYGGGPGMIFKVEPIYRVLRGIKTQKSLVLLRRAHCALHSKQAGEVGRAKVKNQNLKSKIKNQKSKIILLDPGGEQFDHKMAKKFSKLDHVIFICGRYEGVDARVDKLIDEKVSIGPYVLSGGELPAMIMVEAIARLRPGVLGHAHSALDETFSIDKDYVEYPQYTRPEVFEYKEKEKIKKLKVPQILLSGDHEKIKEWRQKNRK